MRRLLLCLMLLAVPAHAARLAVVKPYAMPGSVSPPEYSYSERDLRGAIKALGIQADFISQSALAQNTGAQGQDLDLALGNGSVVIGGVTRTYGATVHFWWGSGFARHWSYNADTLTRQAAWPATSQLFIGPPTITGSTQWSTSSTCSTGIGASSGATPFGDGEGSQPRSNGRAASNYVAGSSLVWKNWNSTYKLGFGSLSGWPGITRGIVGTQTVLGPGQYETCNACDGGARTDPPDSVTMWYRQRTTGTGAPYGSRLIFAWPAAQGSNNGAVMQYVMALAALDSACGGTLIGQEPGWTPKKFAVYIGKALYHSGFATTGNDDDHGTFLPDSAKLKAVCDSLASLGVPITIGVNASRDTLRAYPNELGWYSRIPLAKFAPECYVGVFSGGSTGKSDTTTRYKITDTWGTQRSRSLYLSVPPYTPTHYDSTLYGNLYWVRTLMDSVFGARSARSVYPPRGDWVANQFNRSNLPDKNEFARAVYSAGYRTLIIDPDNPDVNPNPSFGTATGGTFVGPAVNVDGLFAAERSIPIYSDSTWSQGNTTTRGLSQIGRLKFAGMRVMRSESGALNLSLSHNYTEEMFWGALTGNWWRTDIPYYYHYFHTPLSVLHTDTGYLAGNATGNNQVAGWWQIKHMVNQIKAVNVLAGRSVMRIVYAEDL